MTPDELLAKAIDEIKAEDEDKVFEALRMICEAFNWDISRRDPGPECDLEGGWCATHNAWIDEHDWRNAALMAAPISAWPEEKIRQSTAELRDLNSKLSKDEIKESYRHLALVRRVP